ncbi:UDP-2,3-diacylglucosamine diphosphatase LpxI [Candidatus Babeliales bacterium]|nr:UDP-2,3-diacylglucosamine diphosphatase LpxI [Candidatus Babeliales bacterium]
MNKKLVAVIAGTGNLPVEACKKLKQENCPFFVISLFPENNGSDLLDVIENKNELIKQNVYKATEILNLLKTKKTKKVLLIGKVEKSHLLKKIKLDWLTIKLLTSLLSKGDKPVMEKILSILEENGIEAMRQNEILDSLFVPPGVLTGKITNVLEQDIRLGLDTAKHLSKCDIGQTVVIKDGMILAVEAIEGTDKCILRGLELGKKEIVICKAARSDQNKKYDLPTLGPDTLKNIKKEDVAAIAWQSNQTFIAEKEKFISLAKDLEITLISV